MTSDELEQWRQRQTHDGYTHERARRRELVTIALVFGVVAVVLLGLSRRPVWPPSRAIDAVTWILRLSLVADVVCLVYWAAEPPDDGRAGKWHR